MSPDRPNSFVRIEDIGTMNSPGYSMNQQQQPVNPDTIKVTGTLKFFYENDNYGFLVGDNDGKDVFFHFDDVKHTGLTKEQLMTSKDNCFIRFAFNKLAYFGRYGLSMKAINIDLVEIIPFN